MSNVYRMPDSGKINEHIIKLSVATAKIKACTDFFNGKSLDYLDVNKLYGKYSRCARAYINTTNELREEHGH